MFLEIFLSIIAVLFVSSGIGWLIAKALDPTREREQ